MTNKKRVSSEVLRDVVNNAILEKKGNEIVNLDLRNLYNSISDFFIICHASSDVHMQAIADEIKKQTREVLKDKPFSSEGYDSAEWIILDYFDVVVHIFIEDKRSHYNLEDVWADAERTNLDEFGNAVK